MTKTDDGMKQLRGFAAMDPAKVKKIASRGGKAAHAKGVAHEWTSSQAREAGRKGGLAHHVKRPGAPKRGSASAPAPAAERPTS